MQYFLAPHVHLCVTDDHAVLLDLKRDKYIGVAAGQMSSLAAWIHGWPAHDQVVAPAATRALPAVRGKLLESMLTANMLTGDAAVGKRAAPFRMTEATATLLEPDLEARPVIQWQDILQFMTASVVAKIIFRYHSIERVAFRVQARKARCATVRPEIDINTLRARVEAFMYLHPLLFRAQDQCLFDSFALVEFLARDGIFPLMVFGVKTGPFGAHCWVQAGATVLNDSCDYVRRFTPILAL